MTSGLKYLVVMSVSFLIGGFQGAYAQNFATPIPSNAAPVGDVNPGIGIGIVSTTPAPAALGQVSGPGWINGMPPPVAPATGIPISVVVPQVITPTISVPAAVVPQVVPVPSVPTPSLAAPAPSAPQSAPGGPPSAAPEGGEAGASSAPTTSTVAAGTASGPTPMLPMEAYAPPAPAESVVVPGTSVRN